MDAGSMPLRPSTPDYRHAAGNHLKKGNLILMRSTIRRLALVPGTLLAAGALVLGMATAAGATVTTTNWGGYRAGNGNWHFRYVQGTFVVPQKACVNTGSGVDDYQTAGVHIGGSIDYVTAGVICNGQSNTGLSGFYSFNNGSTSGTGSPIASINPSGDDTVFASLYYDSSNNQVNVYVYDETKASTLINTWLFAGNGQFKWASDFATIIASQPFGPPSGTSITLVPFTGVRVTSLDGTKGTGMAGPWGVQDEEAFNGAHEILGGSGPNSNYSSFNVTEYGNA
jgi:hypothetical protein